MRHRHAVLALLLAVAAGCAQPSREELAKQVLAADPDFASVLTRYQEIANRIQTYQQELALKRTTVDRDIAQLRKELADTAANVRAKTGELKQRLEPDRQKLELAIGMGLEKRRVLTAQRADLGRRIAQLRKANKASGTAGSEAERAQLDELQRDADRFSQEIAVLHQHLRLLRTKLLLLRF